MTALAWALAGIWGLVFLGTARGYLRRLPGPGQVIPPFGLWLPDGGDAPELSPAPAVVHRGPVPPPWSPARWLVLSGGVTVSPDLPQRLAACGAEMVSVFPMPRGQLVGLAVERLRRDFAGVDAVTDVASPAGFADGRCAWLLRSDLALPGEGEEPVLRAARARKAHGLGVDLRDPRGPDGAALVEAPARSLAFHRDTLDDLAHGDPLVRRLVVWAPLLLCLGPLLLLVTSAWPPAALALVLATAGRLVLAMRDGFGAGLPLAGQALEAWIAVHGMGAPRTRALAPFPELPAARPQALTGSRGGNGGAWLDNAAVPFLARSLGGSATVMEQIYRNRPAGRTPLGRGVDRAVHLSVGARSVRHRALMVAEAARALAPERLLSVPCGSAPDAALVAAPETTLVDPDPAARELAAARCPQATVVDGDVEHGPIGPFDVILYVGLLEYLEDAQVVRHLTALRGRLDPDGALITSTTAEHPERERMASWLGWHTRTRSPDALALLLDAAGYRLESRIPDPLGAQWVLVARPRPTGSR